MPEIPVPVLIHGFLGFVRAGPLEYFRGVAEALQRDGIAPLIPALPATASIAERASVLTRALAVRGAAHYVLIGHSMGGLDARYLAARLDPDRRIQAVVTVGTPHRGSPVAIGGGLLPGFARLVCGPAMRDLDPRTREAEPIPDRADVRYVAYAAQRPLHELPWAIRAAAGSIPGENDGLVEVSSAQWGRAAGIVRADHFELAGWNLGWSSAADARPFDHIAFWRQIVAEAILSP